MHWVAGHRFIIILQEVRGNHAAFLLRWWAGSIMCSFYLWFLADSSDLTSLIAASALLLSETCGLPPFPFFFDGFYREISSFRRETRVSTVWSLVWFVFVLGVHHSQGRV
jgi:hypothetical protein